MLISEECRYEVTDTQRKAGAPLLCVPLYACVRRHVTPPSTQTTRSETLTFASVSEAWSCVFGGKGNNFSVSAYLEVEA